MKKFEDGIVIPESWFRQSQEMYEASKSLYEISAADEPIQNEEDNYRRVGAMKGAMLLLGLAMENALKGAFVYRNKPDISDGRLHATYFQSPPHDLLRLARNLELELSEDLMRLLGRLTIFVKWASKYQSAMNKSDQDQAKGRMKLSYPKDYELVKEMISSLRDESGFDEVYGWKRRD